MDSELIRNATLLAIAGFNVVSAVLAWRTNTMAAKTHDLTKQVEVATNSMKDALIVAEKKLSFGEGREEGKSEQNSSPRS